ncbi:MAG: C_GCAxxG_C_C family protein [Firmicutes bacterium]|nr:C_GCAxxG_C_C family protein [Bacillota bacterium]
MQYPWPYTKLDPEVTRRIAHDNYFGGACAYGASSAIIHQLRDKIGYPYTILPADMFKYGEGGAVGWGTLCGALNGAAAVITLVAGDKYHQLVDEMIGWYTVYPFPSDKSNQYAQDGTFKEYKVQKELPKNVSGSPLCHVSVTRWCKETGYASGSPERSERCARLTGDTAAHAVELLNKLQAGQVVSKFELDETTEECRTCHAKGKDFEIGGWTRGKLKCTNCHEPHENPFK